MAPKGLTAKAKRARAAALRAAGKLGKKKLLMKAGKGKHKDSSDDDDELPKKKGAMKFGKLAQKLAAKKKELSKQQKIEFCKKLKVSQFFK